MTKHSRDPVSAIFCPFPGCSKAVYGYCTGFCARHKLNMIDTHLANEHQDFRGAKDTDRGRAYDFLVSDRQSILNSLNKETLCHLANVDKNDLENLYERKLRILARHPAKPNDHIAFKGLRGNTGLALDAIDFNRMPNSELILHIRMMRSILQGVWAGA